MNCTGRTAHSATGALFVLALAMAGSLPACWAQALSDPTRPPGAGAHTTAEGADATGSGTPVLQSTLVSKGRRIAIIDGRQMKVGDQLGTARIVAIDATSVTLREAGKSRVLELHQDVKMSDSKSAKLPGSRAGSKEGTR